jgi:hypothetical protein
MAVLSRKGKSTDQKPCGVCWNCREKGHFKDKCPKPTKDKKDPSPKKTRSANATIKSDSKNEGAFFMEDLFEDDDMLELELASNSDKSKDSMPELEPVSDSDNESDVE